MTFDFVAAGGSTFLDKLAHRLGIVLTDGQLLLPEWLGSGYIRTMTLSRGLTIVLFRCRLTEDLIIRRQEAPRPNNVLIITFLQLPVPAAITVGTLPTPHLTNQLPRVQITSNDLAFDTMLRADQDLYALSLAVHTDYLKERIRPDTPHSILQTMLSQRQPYLYDALISPAIEAVTANLLANDVPAELHNFYYSFQVHHLLYLLFVELLKRENTPTQPLNLTDAITIYRIRDTLLAQLDQPPSLRDLAQQAGMSESKLQRLFRQIFGSSLYTYYQSFRMQEAACLLQTHRLSVSEVGYQRGFTNLSHFSRQFEKYLGSTPKKYARQLPTTDATYPTQSVDKSRPA